MDHTETGSSDPGNRSNDGEDLQSRHAGPWDAVEDTFAATARYQAAVGRHMVVVVDGFVGYREIGDETPYGGRLELVVKF